jgi:hypothetical protein
MILPHLCSIKPSVFHFVFRNNNIFTEQGRQPSDQPPTWSTRSLYLPCPTGTGRPSYTRGYQVPYLSPSTTSRATVEVFQPSSTRGSEPIFLTSFSCRVYAWREFVICFLTLLVIQSRFAWLWLAIGFIELLRLVTTNKNYAHCSTHFTN